VGEEHGCPTLGLHDGGIGVTKTSSGDFGIGSDLVITGLAATNRFSERARPRAMATIARRKRSAFARRDLIGGYRLLRLLVIQVRISAHGRHAPHTEGTSTSLYF
jgi:hypothetical protein